MSGQQQISHLPEYEHFHDFSVLKHTGHSPHANLATQMELMHSSHPLHVLVKHKDAILKGFNTDAVRRSIRFKGGLSKSQRTNLLNKIVAKSKELKKDQHAHKLLRDRLIYHFRKRPEIAARVQEQYSEDLQMGGTAQRSIAQNKSTADTISKLNVTTRSGIHNLMEQKKSPLQQRAPEMFSPDKYSGTGNIFGW